MRELSKHGGRLISSKNFTKAFVSNEVERSKNIHRNTKTFKMVAWTRVLVVEKEGFEVYDRGKENAALYRST